MFKVTPHSFAFQRKKLIFTAGQTIGRVDFKTHPLKISSNHFVIKSYLPNSITIEHTGKHSGRVVNPSTGDTVITKTGETISFTPNEVYYPSNDPDIELYLQLERVKVERTEERFSIKEFRYALHSGVVESMRRKGRRNLEETYGSDLTDAHGNEISVEQKNLLVVDIWKGKPKDWLAMVNMHTLDTELGLRKQDIVRMIKHKNECEKTDKLFPINKPHAFHQTWSGPVKLTRAMKKGRHEAAIRRAMPLKLRQKALAPEDRGRLKTDVDADSRNDNEEYNEDDGFLVSDKVDVRYVKKVELIKDGVVTTVFENDDKKLEEADELPVDEHMEEEDVEDSDEDEEAYSIDGEEEEEAEGEESDAGSPILCSCPVEPLEVIPPMVVEVIAVVDENDWGC
jgi:hypothetical protein